ncbi:type I 3-dehydroquinate dehydratase [Pseudolactococcus reticulitermitis]|uniref:3-dehydroquinate dehydratase n=1 Tax=Pseudolactococcus reticulitermitis TaxID=2025039 RepID=A0A224XCT5_9LACT|nr:type I 3-dehydroquinate dehydratase [Lactococcus reticulitermitis]GAX47431.1 3-dehydroquinate dehydratase I [Lactococcus reticulitermitis]
MKIVVPIMPKSLAEIVEFDVAQYAAADLIEWRVDFMPVADLNQAAQEIKAQFPNHEILFTYRTEDKAETLISADDYAALVQQFSTEFAYIDVEILKFPSIILPENAVVSYHDFTQIPQNLPEILSKMVESRATTVKFAAMPQKQSDVLRLMTETLRFSEAHPDVTLVSMAMGELGKITRVASDSFGSSWTFASVAGASAPGQLTLEEMVKFRELL